MELLCGMVWILKQRTYSLHLQDGSYLASRVSERHRLVPAIVKLFPIIISFHVLWLMSFCLLKLCLLCWTCAVSPDKWEQEGGRNALYPQTSLTAILWLRLRESGQSGGLEPLMGSLEVLHLSHNGISSIGSLELSRLTGLKALFLEGTYDNDDDV